MNYPPTVTECTIGTVNGTLCNCTNTVSSIGYTQGIAMNSKDAYIVAGSGTVFLCDFEGDGSYQIVIH